jgi:hypothetical protein
MNLGIDDITMTATGRDRGPVAMGAIRLTSSDRLTTPAGFTVEGPGVVSVWRFGSGRMVGQYERGPGQGFESLPVEVTR